MSRHEHQYPFLLNERGDTLQVWFVSEGPEVLAFAVKLEAYVDGAHREVVRYDSGHDRPHRDTLDWFGTPASPKRWMPEGTTNNAALTYAIDDLTANHERYVEDFLRRKP